MTKNKIDHNNLYESLDNPKKIIFSDKYSFFGALAMNIVANVPSYLLARNFEEGIAIHIGSTLMRYGIGKILSKYKECSIAVLMFPEYLGAIAGKATERMIEEIDSYNPSSEEYRKGLEDLFREEQDDTKRWTNWIS